MHTLLPVPQAFDVNVVTPGVVGFITIFLIAVATVFLIMDMTRRIRRARYRGELAERRTGSPDGPDDPEA